MENVIRSVQPDMLLHLGDHFSDLARLRERIALPETVGVRGNCDAPGPPERRLLEIAGKRLLMTHGHLYGVKSGLNRLWFAGREAEADLVLFGHTHSAVIDDENGITLMNPGSIGQGFPPSYGLITITEESLKTEIIRL